LNLETLKNVPRLLIEAKLVPVQGDRFQPTGFADLGAATYQRPDGTPMLLVETAQSMANRLEAVCVAEDRVRANADLEGLPYVLVKFTGEGKGETSSLYEAHRLNSPFILKSTGFEERFARDIGFETGRMIDWKKIATTFFRLDPSSLVHGTFMANFEDGRVRLPRALTSFIEAENVREVASGGVKNNPLDPRAHCAPLDTTRTCIRTSRTTAQSTLPARSRPSSIWISPNCAATDCPPMRRASFSRCPCTRSAGFSMVACG
jgi:CRISPR-associated protein Csb1